MSSLVCIFFTVAVLGVTAVAQDLPRTTTPLSTPDRGEPKAEKSLYPGEPVVVERRDTAYRYNADGTGSKLETQIVRVQSEAAARVLGVLSVPYATGTQRVEVVYLRVRKPNGAVIITPPGDAQDQSAALTQAAPLYSDLHLMQLPVRGLAQGDRLEYQVRTVYAKAAARDQFWGAETFGQGAVVLERSVELRVPAGKYVQISCPRFPARVTDEGGDKVYRWSGSQLKPTSRAKAAAGEQATVQADGPRDEEAGPSLAWTSFHSWADVGAWYRALSAEASTPTPALKAKADAVVYGATTAEAKIRALYSYVSTEVRSIDLALGAGGFQPHAAAEVLANQYGDGNDKHVLLSALLRAENLPASTVLIGAGVNPDEATPAPGWFNHVLTLTSDGAHGDIWLDTTPEVAPFRMLDSAFRDKLALVIPAQGEPVLRRTPAEPPFPAFTRFEASGTLTAEGKLNAHVDLTLRGDQELTYRTALRSVSPGDWDRVTQFYARREGLGGDSTNTVADRPEKADTPLHVAYDYRGDSYGDWASFRMIPLEPGMILPLADRKTPPGSDVAFGGVHTDTAISKITLPPGFSAELPTPLHLHTDFITLDKTYRLERSGTAGILVTERTLVFKEDKLPGAQWGAYRKFVEEAGASEPWVQLVNTSAHTGPGDHPPAAGENKPAAAELVRQANRAALDRDWTVASRDLDQARAINPLQAGLWSTSGYIASAKGDRSEAAEDYRRELKQHPEDAMVSRLLADLQMREGDTAGAVQTLRAAVALDGKDESSVRLLGSFEARTDLPEAEHTLREGLARLPDSLGIKLALGNVLLKEGKRDEALQLLVEVAVNSQDPEQLNDAAYTLSETPPQLPVAEAAARRSIQLLNSASASVRAGDAKEDAAALLRSLQLIGSWDTYGWVLYQEGNYSEAEPWLRAAWANTYGAEPGRHLGLLLRKQGRAAEASRVFQLAAQAENPVASKAAQGSVGLVAVAAADPKSPRTAASGSGRALASERTFAVPRRADTPSGSALFEFDNSLNAPTVVRFVRGEQGFATLAPALGRIDTHSLIPPGSNAHLLRRGLLTCHAGPTCSLLMLPPRAALAE